MNNGCKHGALVLEPTTVKFTCPSDASKNVVVRAAEVIAADGNGILVAPKQKYHFDIGGMHKEQTQELFARWLENARASTARN
jgi:regulator of RNase E activity RraA